MINERWKVLGKKQLIISWLQLIWKVENRDDCYVLASKERNQNTQEVKMNAV